MRTIAFGPAILVGALLGASAAQAMTVTSPDIKPGGKIADEQVFNSFGCTGQNVSPALSWSGAPKGTKSFAVSMYDPDAPTGSGWWHWWVVNIPPDATSLPKGAGGGTGLPAGAMLGRTDFSTNAYGGPCPPKGDPPHHYHITVYAVDVDKLDVDQNSSSAAIGFNLHFHTLGKGELIGRYGR